MYAEAGRTRHEELYLSGARTDDRLRAMHGDACLVAAEQLLRERDPAQTIVMVIADSEMKYLSTDL